MKLKSRMSLSLVGYTMLVLALFGGTYYFIERRAQRDVQFQEQRKTLAGLTQVCRGMHLTSNPIAALNYVNALANDPAVRDAACVNRAGIVVAHSDPRRIGRRLDEISKTGGADTWKTEIPVAGELIGAAIVNFREDVLAAQIQRKLLATFRQLLLVSVSTFLLAFLVGIALASAVTKPIASLVDAAQAIGAGNWDQRASLPARRDELGILAGEMEAMAQKLKQLDEIKDDFVSSVSHDLRAPLSAIYSYADALLAGTYGALGVKQAAALEYILTTSRSLNLTIDNVLDLAKMKAGLVQLEVEPLDIQDFMERELELYKLLAQKNAISFERRYDPSRPLAMANAQSLARVLSNLIFNALKFTPPDGTITITTRAQPDGVRVDVHNTGAAIRPEDLQRLFHRFERLDRASDKKAAGTGLGLSVVKKLLELNHGTVWASSQPDEGVTFSFLLPGAAHGV